MLKNRNRLWIIIASIAGTVILALGGLYIALDFIEEQQERQQLTHQQQPPRETDDAAMIDIEPPAAEQPPVQEEPAPPPPVVEEPPVQEVPPAVPEQLPAGGQQINLDEARAIAERHLQSRNINATFRAHSGIDREAGTRVWELEYRGADGLTHEFYIDVYTGDIVKFETGDWD